jgi:hypothetical protein
MHRIQAPRPLCENAELGTSQRRVRDIHRQSESRSACFQDYSITCFQNFVVSCLQKHSGDKQQRYLILGSQALEGVSSMNTHLTLYDSDVRAECLLGRCLARVLKNTHAREIEHTNLSMQAPEKISKISHACIWCTLQRAGERQSAGERDLRAIAGRKPATYGFAHDTCIWKQIS